MDRIYLSDAQKASPVWGLIERHLNERLTGHRAKNDNPAGEVETARLRGQIAEIKALLAIAEDPPQV